MQVSVHSANRGWCKPSVGAKHAGISLKVFRGWFKNGLRHVRLDNGRILTRYEWIDSYLKGFEVKDNASKMADDLMEGLDG